MDHSTVQEVQKIADSVEGWLGKREGPYLYQLAKVGSRLGAIVEIGSWQGRSTIWLGKGSETVNGYEIYAIDPHVGGSRRQHNVSTEKAFRENIQRAGLAKKVVPIVALSSDALKGWSRPIGMLWIDGDHRYEAVSGDFLGWSRFVAKDGIIAFHDTYSWEGVRRFVDGEILPNTQYRVLGQIDSILAIQKTSRDNWSDRLRADLTIWLRQVYNRAREKRAHWRALPRKIMRGLAGIG